MIKKILMIGMILFPLHSVYAEEKKYPIWEVGEGDLLTAKVYHPDMKIIPKTIPHKNWHLQHIIWENFESSKRISPNDPQSHYPTLNNEEKKLLKNAIDIKSLKRVNFWINVPGLNKDNIFDFTYNMKIKNNSFVSILNRKPITIPAQHVFVKQYVEYSDKYHTEYACAYSKKDNYYIGCYHTDLKLNSYQEYLVPKGYSLSHNKTNNIAIKRVGVVVEKSGTYIYPSSAFLKMEDYKDINILKQNMGMDNKFIRNWFSKRNIKFNQETNNKFVTSDYHFGIVIQNDNLLISKNGN